MTAVSDYRRKAETVGIEVAMWPFKKKENRTVETPSYSLTEWTGGAGITKTEALNIPAVQACISLISGVVSMLPIRLYKNNDGTKEVLPDDPRVKLLNDDTGDTLDAVQFWSALIQDFFLGKGGYAFINRDLNKVVSLHYVDERFVSVLEGIDPIFKYHEFLVHGKKYRDFDFIKILRNTKNGAVGRSILLDSPLILSTMYHSLQLEKKLMKNEGGKKGIVHPGADVNKFSLDHFREAMERAAARMSNLIATNHGVEFIPFAASPSELQMQENKAANNIEICKLFNMPPDLICGASTSSVNMSRLFTQALRTGILPVMRTIESALNRVLLLESEKPDHFFAFDYMELMKGTGEERANYFKAALETGYMTINEVRRMEQLPDYEHDFVHFNLADSLLNLKTQTIYTPNTGSTYNLNTGMFESGKPVVPEDMPV